MHRFLVVAIALCFPLLSLAQADTFVVRKAYVCLPDSLTPGDRQLVKWPRADGATGRLSVTVKGYLYSNRKRKLAGGLLMLYKDSELVAYKLTKSNGKSTFTNLPSGEYSLRVCGTGVETIYFSKFRITSSSPVDLEITVPLSEATFKRER